MSIWIEKSPGLCIVKNAKKNNKGEGKDDRGKLDGVKERTVFQERVCRDFPGGPVVKIPCFQCRRHGFDP